MTRGTFFWGVIGVLAITILGGIAFVWSEEHEFHDRARLLQADGEPLFMDDFFEPVPDEQNAAVLLDELAAGVADSQIVEMDAALARTIAKDWSATVDAALARPHYSPRPESRHYRVVIVLGNRAEPEDAVRLLRWGHLQGRLAFSRAHLYAMAYDVIRSTARDNTIDKNTAQTCLGLLDRVDEAYVPSRSIRAIRNWLVGRVLDWERGGPELARQDPSSVIPLRLVLYRDVNRTLDMLEEAMRWCDPPTIENERRAALLESASGGNALVETRHAAGFPRQVIWGALDGIRQSRLVRRLLLRTLGRRAPLPVDPRTGQTVTEAEFETWLAAVRADEE